MTLELAFLDVGNADCTVILPSQNQALIIDLPQYRLVREWLLQRNVGRIESMYITHGHKDHFPSLQQLTTFLEEWIVEYGVGTLYLPDDIYDAIQSSDPHVQGKKQKLFEDALGKLRLWRRHKFLRVFRAEKNACPHTYTDLSISVHVLHPDALFVTDFRRLHQGRINDIAVVLRIDYGKFRVLLPSDIEKEGLRDMLEQCTDEDLRCHVLKVPHHGAWQADTQATEQLFMRADPELAIVSVGSTNTYGHVQPGLFQALIQLQQTQRLQHFLCTEVTRTCLHTAQERAAMEKKGLSSKQPCAGTIVVEAEQSGRWLLPNKAAYDAQVNAVEMAACRGRADLAGEAKA